MQRERFQRLARDERLARHAGFWWGLAEGLFFFIVPDVYISFATLFSLRAGAIAWLFSIAGSAIAIVVIYLLIRDARLGLRVLSRLDPGNIRTVDPPCGPGARGRRATLHVRFLVMAGVPLKLYVAQAFALELTLGSVLLWTVFARIVRIAPTFAIVAAMRLLFGRRIDAYAGTWCALLGIFWVAFYVFYFVHMSRV